ncbi:CoA-transferase [Lentzea sp.]|nr:CoA-transferase [Lentzea sp.]HUQ55145.1 CoA-transferase [Lentzea sp.]
MNVHKTAQDAAAATTTVLQVEEFEKIDPEHVVTPGIYVDSVVHIGRLA